MMGRLPPPDNSFISPTFHVDHMHYTSPWRTDRRYVHEMLHLAARDKAALLPTLQAAAAPRVPWDPVYVIQPVVNPV